MPKCPKCGKEIPEELQLCPYCTTSPQSPEQPSGEGIKVQDSVVTGGIQAEGISGGGKETGGVQLQDAVVTGGIHIQQVEDVVHCAISGTAVNAKETFRCAKCQRIIWQKYKDLETEFCTECAELAAEECISLFIVSGSGEGAEYPLNKRVMKLGRDKANDIVLAHDRQVSRRHAEIRRDHEGYTLVDVGSKFGTFVNDHRRQSHRLLTGDIIRLGQTTLGFDTDGCAEETGIVARSKEFALMVEQGEYKGRQFPLKAREYVIGRLEECDICTGSEDGKVSRRHAKLVPERSGGFAIVDLESTNGTFVNGKKIPVGKNYQLQRNDRIKIGFTVLRYFNRGSP